jgi:hypothetical protein
MNYFAHALPFLDEAPYFVAGTAVPDWLSVVDRQSRVRRKVVAAWVADSDPTTAAIAKGMLQHLADDARFHEGRAFAESSWMLTALARDALDKERGLRPSFLGHLLVEVMLDASLIAESPDGLTKYYDLLESVDGQVIQETVNRMTARPAERLAWMVVGFCRERILWDYADDGRLMVRLNQVMRRVGLDLLPERFREILPQARRIVTSRRQDLLEGIPVPEPWAL